MQTQLGGQMPSTAAQLQLIPGKAFLETGSSEHCKRVPAWLDAGIGAYTSRAVASIAAGEPVAVVDANVVRVLARLRCLAEDSSGSAAARLHAQLAGQLLEPSRPGDLNQVALACCAMQTVHSAGVQDLPFSKALATLLSRWSTAGAR